MRANSARYMSLVVGEGGSRVALATTPAQTAVSALATSRGVVSEWLRRVINARATSSVQIIPAAP